MFLSTTATHKATLMLAALLVCGAVQAEEYYKADPAKMAQLEAQRCSKLYRDGQVIRTRLGSGINHDYDVVKMKKRLSEIDYDFGKYCTNWQPPATPVPPTPATKHKR